MADDDDFSAAPSIGSWFSALMTAQPKREIRKIASVLATGFFSHDYRCTSLHAPQKLCILLPRAELS